MAIHNVKFEKDGEFIDSYLDLGLILSSRDIEAPKVKDHIVDIVGADGSIDLTEVLGRIYYENRTISLTFKCLDDPKDFWQIFSNVQNKLHGKRFKIWFDDDEDWYYIGRVSIDKWQTDKVVGSMTFDIDAEPYKYWRDETLIIEDVAGSKTIRLPNSRKPVNPVFNVNAAMSLVYGSTTVIAPVNQDFYSADILLLEGENWLTVNGTGEITIRYQMGSL